MIDTPRVVEEESRCTKMTYGLLLRVVRFSPARRAGTKERICSAYRVRCVRANRCQDSLHSSPTRSVNPHAILFGARNDDVMQSVEQMRLQRRRETPSPLRHARVTPCEPALWLAPESTVVASYSDPCFLLKSAIYHGVMGRC